MACIIPCVAQSQSTIKTMLSQQEEGYSKNILELLLNLNEINPGTKIAPVVKTAIAKDTLYRRSEEDTTSRQDNKIEIYETAEGIHMKLDLKEDDQRIEISAFNMLGKKVKVFYSEQARKDGVYTFATSDLPKGFYLCIVQGENFRLREKFIVSR